MGRAATERATPALPCPGGAPVSPSSAPLGKATSTSLLAFRKTILIVVLVMLSTSIATLSPASLFNHSFPTYAQEAKTYDNHGVEHWIKEFEFYGGSSDWRWYHLRAIKALAEIGGARAVDALIKRLNFPDATVRWAAVEALGKIGDPRAVEPLISQLGWGLDEMVTKSLIKIGKPAVESLIRILNDYSNHRDSVLIYVVKALGEIEDPRAIEPLLRGLERVNHFVIHFIAEALERLKWKPGSQRQEILYLFAKDDWDGLIAIGAPAIGVIIQLANVGHDFFITKAFERLGDQTVFPLLISHILAATTKDEYQARRARVFPYVGRTNKARLVTFLQLIALQLKSRYDPQTRWFTDEEAAMRLRDLYYYVHTRAGLGEDETRNIPGFEYIERYDSGSKRYYTVGITLALSSASASL